SSAFDIDWSRHLVLRYLGEDRAAAAVLQENLVNWTRMKGDGHEFVRFMKAFQDLDRGHLEPARRVLDELWRRRRDLDPLICTLDTGKAYVEALTWSGAYEQALAVAQGVLDYAEFRREHGDYSEKHYDVAVSRDVMALLLANPPEASRG